MRPYALSLALLAAAVAAALALGPVVNETTTALALLLVAFVAASRFGTTVGTVTAVAAVLAFNFFFLPPTGTFRVDDPLNWVALVAFLTVALVTGELSSRARRRAEEADASRRTAERLYAELQQAFARETEAEAFKRSERLKSALLDAVTHNLRTPITSLKASVTTLQAADELSIDAESRRELLSVMVEETDRLNGMVEDLIGVARIEAGDVRLSPTWCSVGDVVAGAIGRLPRPARERVRTTLPADLPVVYADARAFEEVVFQLLENAVKYAPAETTIAVSASMAGERLTLDVDDDGPGVPMEEREAIFTRFQRGQRAAASGLGMGLAIARGLARAHGGDVAVTGSPRRRGARFSLVLPIGDDDKRTARAAHHAPTT